MKKTVITICALAVSLALVSAEDAEAIVRGSRDRIAADTVSTRSRMLITAKDGSTTERLLDQYSADSPEGKRTVIVFQKPAAIAGTRFLTVEKKGGGDDRWIFLPSLGKVRRIASSEGSGSFMGTDLSYDDISAANRDASLDTHVLLREEMLEGRVCDVIESKPQDGTYQYGKMVSWIERDTKVARKIELYDRKGNLFKLLEVQKLQEVQGRLTPMVTRMGTIPAKTSTTITVDIIKYDDRIPDGVFTVDYLSTGRLK